MNVTYPDGNAFVRGVYVSGSYAYVADDSDGLKIVDISDPTTPVKVGEFYDGEEFLTYARGVFISGSYAYVVKGANGVEIIDISDPTAP